MKTLMIAMLSFIGLNSSADTYSCFEQLPPGPIGGGIIKVVVKETKKIKNTQLGGKTFDGLFQVDVKVTHENGPTKNVLKKFSALATVEDVVYTISSVKANGTKIMIFLDEADDAWMELYEDGYKREVHLSCSWKGDDKI